MKLKQTLLIFVGIILFSFVLNFLWESLHGYSLYTDHVIYSDKYVRMMVYMSFMDAVTILGMYLFFAFIYKNILWLNEVNLRRFIIFFILGLFVGVFAEYRAVYVAHEWHYNNQMPVIFGIGLSPLVQLSVTGVFSLWIAKRLTDV